MSQEIPSTSNYNASRSSKTQPLRNDQKARKTANILKQWDELGKNVSSEETYKPLFASLVSAGWIDATENTPKLISPDGTLPLGDEGNVLQSATQQNLPTKPSVSVIREAMEKELGDGYDELRVRANMLLKDTRLIRQARQRIGIVDEPDNNIQNLKALADGHISSVVSKPTLLSARAVARVMEAEPDRALDIAIEDLSKVFERMNSPTGSSSNITHSSVRDSLTKRSKFLEAALPGSLQDYPSVAFMHLEHEKLGRTYINQETMCGDPISDVPRASFWATEDGYAWDLDELASCLAVTGGVLRNPLSRQLFSRTDIRAIVQHPSGKRLAALQVQQSELAKGVRAQTIEEMSKLSTVLLEDDTIEQISSHQAIDEFLSYVATLPAVEQQAIDELRIEARDSHTGQPFDCTIGEAVRDGKANKICLHKTGDLVGQGARHLRLINKN